MYEYVLNTIEYQPYAGAMKGPLAVLQTKQGNDWDTATLLKELFSHAGINVNYANARIIENRDAVLRWLGVSNAKGAYDVLYWAGLGPGLYKKTGDVYDGLDADTEAAETEYIVFYHTWLHRNAGGGLPEMHLDPSWRYRDFQPGVPGVATAKPFDDDLQADYFSMVRQGTTAEFYEDAVRSWLAQDMSTTSIADVAYDGAIHPVSVTALPQVFPFDSFAVGTKDEHASLSDFDGDFDNDEDNETFVHKLRISVDLPQPGNYIEAASLSDGSTTLTAHNPVFESWMEDRKAPIIVATSAGDKVFTITDVIDNRHVVVTGDATSPQGPFCARGFRILTKRPIWPCRR